ncbi:MAG TPA: ATPase, T2SS/T4P/T4SS family [Pyrinomonadaceae bacterium]|nr:ATPase, T2SS/T4P/T4SS family [Pyrinomonadaceae bacterium]
MSEQNNSSNSEKLVFYVDEDSEDFTFYLQIDEKKTVVQTLLQNGLNQIKSPKAKIAGNKTFTFSEEVVVKSRRLTKDNLEPVDDSFWTKLRDSTGDTCYSYLREKLEAKAKNDSELTESLAALKSGDFKKEHQKILLKALAEVLTDALDDSSLESRPWIDEKLPAREDALIKALPDGEIKKQWRNRDFLQRACSDLIKETQIGRGLICFSYVGKYLSITFRRYTAREGYAAEKVTDRRKYLFSLYEYCDVIYKEVFERTDSTQHAHGLLVITGSTKSAKSEIARALIYRYLTTKNGTRKPHLVTFEDPVERFYANERSQKLDPWFAVQRSEPFSVIDYTPRQKGKDVALLRDALTDALRQTPAAFFVGETRDKKEWELLLDFAATGHLIVTTAHANSLVEAMHKIFEARRVKTPADRSEIGSKLFGLAHLRMTNVPINDAGKTAEVLFPALWRRTERGVAGLTSDGLASLLPHRSSDDKSNGQPSCLGRRWLMGCLVDSAQNDLTEIFKPTYEDLKLRVFQKATEWDLQGV